MSSPAPARTFDVRGTEPVAFDRLVGVELRKMTDTRAGLWLMAAIAVGTLAVEVGLFVARDAQDRTFLNLLRYTVTPQALLVPVLAILLVTSEWGQRTTLTTFALVPSRPTVIAAKAGAALTLGLAALALAAVVAALAAVVGGADAPFAGITAAALGNLVTLQSMSMLQGLALGLLVLSSAGAVALFYVLPVVTNLLASLWPWFAQNAAWLNLADAQTPLYDPVLPAAGELVQLVVASLWWIVVPGVVGVARVLTSEVK